MLGSSGSSFEDTTKTQLHTPIQGLGSVLRSLLGAVIRRKVRRKREGEELFWVREFLEVGI